MKTSFVFITLVTLLCIVTATYAGAQELSNQVYNSSACGLNYFHKSVKVTNRFPLPPGKELPVIFDITELPQSCYTIERVFLWWTVSGTDTAASVTVAMPDGGKTTVASIKLGAGPDKCWQQNVLSTVAYRADITSLITSNGRYGFTPSTSEYSTDGLTLLVIYRETTETSFTGTLIINDGLIIGTQSPGGSQSLSFKQNMSGFQACEDSDTATAFLIASDLQNAPGYTHTSTLNGTTKEFSQYFWNVDELATQVTQAQTQARFGINVEKDCFAWIAMGLYYQTTSCQNCPPPSPKPVKVQIAPVPSRICEGDSLVLMASGAMRYRWTSNPPDLYSTQPSLTVHPKKSTTYSVTGTDADGCIRTVASVHVTVEPRAKLIIYAETTTLCRGAQVNLVAFGAKQYQWLPHPTLSATSGSTVVASPEETTTYTVQEVTTASCPGMASITITVSGGVHIPTPGPLSICPGGKIRLQIVVEGGVPPLKFAWWPHQNINDPTAEAPIVSPLQDQTYSVTVTDALGCVVQSSVLVTVGNALTPRVIAYGPTSFCAGDSVMLNAGTGYTSYLWSTGETTSTIVVKNTGVYNVSVSSLDGCKGTSHTVSVTVSPRPAVEAGVDVTVCAGTGVQLSAIGTGSFEWFPPDGLSATDIPNPFVQPEHTTTYTVRVTSEAGCSSVDSVVVTVQSGVSAGEDVTLCKGDSVRLQSIGAERVEWIEGENISNPTDVHPIVLPTQSGRYIVRGYNGACISYDTVTVQVLPTPVVSITAATLSVCVGDSLQLIATGATSYRWLNAPGLHGTTTPEVIVTPTVSTQYRVIGYSTTGCADTAAIYVQINHQRQLTIGITDNSAQPGDTLILPLMATVQGFNIIENVDIRTSLRLPKNSLQLIAITGANAVIDSVADEYIVDFDFPALDVYGEVKLASLTCRALLSPSTMATITIGTSTNTYSCISVTSAQTHIPISMCVPYGLRKFEQGSVAVTPLPAEETLTVSLHNLSGSVRVTLYDMFGRAIGEKVVELIEQEEQVVFDIRQYSAGTYLVVVQNAERSITLPVPVTK